MSNLRTRVCSGKVFLLSAIGDNVRKDLARKIHLLGGKYFDLQDFKAVCTHVVCGKLSRSEKFLGACATGKWVLHPDYILDSYIAGCWLDEEQYEWCDEHIAQKYEVDMSLGLAARRWRFLLGDVTAAFTGWKVAVIAGAKRSKVIKRLLISGGAEVFNMRIPVRNPAKVADTIGYIFVSENNMKSVIHLIDYGVLCVKPEFIGDFLIKDPQPDPMDYLVQVNSVEELPETVLEPLSQDSFLMNSQRSVYMSPQKPGSSHTFSNTPLSSTPSSQSSVATGHSQLESDQGRSRTPTVALDKLPAVTALPKRTVQKDKPISKLVNNVTEKIGEEESPGPSNSTRVKSETEKNSVTGNSRNIDLSNEEIIDLIDISDDTDEVDNMDSIKTDKKQTSESSEHTGEEKMRKSKRNLVKKSPAWKMLIPGTKSSGPRSIDQPVKIKEEHVSSDDNDSVHNTTISSPGVRQGSTVKRNLLDSMRVGSTANSTPAKKPVTKKHLLETSLCMSPITKFFKRIEPIIEGNHDRLNKSDLSNKPASSIPTVTKCSPLNKSEVLYQTKGVAASEHSKDGMKRKSSYTSTKGESILQETAKAGKECADNLEAHSEIRSRHILITNHIDQTGEETNDSAIGQALKAHNETIIDHSRNREKNNKKKQLVGKQSLDNKGDRKRKSTDTEEADVLDNGPSERKRVTRSTPTKNEENLLIRSPDKPPNIHDFTTIVVSPSKRKKPVTEKLQDSDLVSRTKTTAIITTAIITDHGTGSHSVRKSNNEENHPMEKDHQKRKVNDTELQQVLTDIKRRKIGICEWCSSSFIVNLREMENVPESVCMPSTATEIFVATLEDGFVFEALEYLSSQITFKFYPQASLISEIMRNVLLITGEEIIANMSYNILCHMLMLHPPITASLQDVYLRALAGCKVGEDWQVGAEWNFIKQCFSNILTSDDVLVKRNNRLLFKFILKLLQHNIQHFLSTQEDFDTRHMLLRIIWSPSYHVVFNKRCGSLVDFMSDIIQSYQTVRCNTEKKHLLEMLEGILWMFAMVTECCRVLECGNIDTIKALQADKTSAFVHEISRKLIELDVREPVLLETIFQGLQLPWLRVGVCQQLLHTYDDYLLTEEYLQDVKSLTLLLIVTKYIYLLPIFDVLPRTPGCRSPAQIRTKQKGKGNSAAIVTNCLTVNTDMNKENIDKMTLKAKKKNPKGETPLHVACIRNDVATVKKLLKVPGIDVNATDNVGWTPLHEACNHGHTECVRELLKFIPSKTMDVFFTKDSTQCRKVDLLATNGEGITPLHDAVLNDNLDVCHLLLQHGGPKLLEAQTCLGYTPPDLAETDDMAALLSSYKHVRRKHSDSQAMTGTQESTISLEEDFTVAPSDVLYQEVLYIEGEQVYANFKSTKHYVRLVTLLVKHYIALRNLHVICQSMSENASPRSKDTADENQSDHSFRNNEHLNNNRNCVSGSSTSKNILTSHVLDNFFEKKQLKLSFGKQPTRGYQTVSTEPVLDNEEVENTKKDLNILENFQFYLNLFTAHLKKICRPEDFVIVKEELQGLSFLTEGLTC